MADIEEVLSDIALSDISTSSDGDFSSEDEQTDGEIRPYQFEPRLMRRNEDSSSISDENEDEDHQDESRIDNTRWCSCRYCFTMPTHRECQCCVEIGTIQEKMAQYTGETGEEIVCITKHPGFSAICLNRYVLEVAYYQYRQQHGGVNMDNANEKWRYNAYMQLARWCWGFLGKEVRVPLPACAVTEIRKTFPSSDYRGFQEA